MDLKNWDASGYIQQKEGVKRERRRDERVKKKEGVAEGKVEEKSEGLIESRELKKLVIELKSNREQRGGEEESIVVKKEEQKQKE